MRLIINVLKENKAYEKPTTAYVVDYELAKEARSKKSQSEDFQKSQT